MVLTQKKKTSNWKIDDLVMVARRQYQVEFQSIKRELKGAFHNLRFNYFLVSFLAFLDFRLSKSILDLSSFFFFLFFFLPIMEI